MEESDLKILVFCQYYYPERFLITEIAEQLVKKGNNVTVITGKPNYNFPGGEVPEEYKGNAHTDETINGVRVLRCNTPGRKNGKLNLVRNYLAYASGAEKKANQLIEEDFDIVFCYQVTPVLQLRPASRYAKKRGIKLFCYCLDLAPESGLRVIKGIKPIADYYKNESKRLYNKCDMIGVTSQSFIEYQNRVNDIPFSKLVYIPQHAPSNLLKEDLSKEIGEKKIFLFAGNIGTGASLDTIVKATKHLVDENQTNFEVHFVGEGSKKGSLMKLAQELHLNDYIKFFDGVSFDQMPSVYKSADVLLVTLRSGQITIPGKLQAYMSTGKPIIGAMGGSGRDLIAESGCGKCADAEDDEGLANLMMDFLSEPVKYKKMGQLGKEYFLSHFTLEIFSQHVESILKEMIGEQK